jgi:Icc-related predicted phosphoesterase
MTDGSNGSSGGTRSPDTVHVEAPLSDGTVFRVAAVGDLHCGREGHGASRQLLNQIAREAEESADILLLCGDLTSHGRPEELRDLLDALQPLTVPVIAVLGNHEYEAGTPQEVAKILSEHGIRVLDGDALEVNGVGIAGVKGFAGGFGRAALTAFGEPMIKAFVQEALDEALKLENALRRLATPVKIALLHYSPTVETIAGEPLEIQAFLGSSRLMAPIEAMGVDVVFHGHAHTGKLEGSTPSGIPVFNVALPLLQAHGRVLHRWEVQLPVPSVSGT